MLGLDDASSSEEEQLWQDWKGGGKSPNTRQGGQGSQGQELEKDFRKVTIVSSLCNFSEADTERNVVIWLALVCLYKPKSSATVIFLIFKIPFPTVAV